jgi:hypothetical protein
MTELEEDIKEYLLDYVGDSDIDTTLEIDNYLVDVQGYIKTYGYVEDDNHCGYMNGTGYNVTTSADISLKINVCLCDDEGNEVKDNIKIDIDKIVEALYSDIVD